MKTFTLVTSAVFVAIGIMMIVDGTPYGWLVTGFFMLTLLVAVFERRFRVDLPPDFRLVITPDQVACEFRKKKRESIRWEDVTRIWIVTTSDGPWRPDQWLVFEGEREGCSVPTEAAGFDAIWDELKPRFPGFDYQPMIEGGTDAAKRLCWERQGIPT